MLRPEIGVLLIVEAGQIGKNAEVRVVQDLVRVHPEDIGHRVALARSLQLGPVLIPAGDLHLNDHVRVHLLGVGVAHSLHPVPLEHVPDLERQVRFAVRRAAPRQGQQQRGSQGR